MSILSRPYFHDENAAFAFLESVVWTDGPVCGKCGCSGRITKVKANADKRIRVGLYRCGDCKAQFRVTVGTVFEHIRLPLHKCLQAAHLMCSSKKGISAHQISRVLEVQYKTAWFLCHRIREAMRSGDLAPFGSEGGAVEVDETFIGNDPDAYKRKGGYQHKNKVLSLVDRDTKQVRSMVVEHLAAASVTAILRENIAKEARVMTDEAGHYSRVKNHFAEHGHTNHKAGEYVNLDDRTIHTNTIEGYFSVFKRGMKGTYQHCGKQHLHRYLAEFDFRYNNRSGLGVEDAERVERSLNGIVGKRLTYRCANP